MTNSPDAENQAIMNAKFFVASLSSELGGSSVAERLTEIDRPGYRGFELNNRGNISTILLPENPLPENDVNNVLVELDSQVVTWSRAITLTRARPTR